MINILQLIKTCWQNAPRRWHCLHYCQKGTAVYPRYIQSCSIHTEMLTNLRQMSAVEGLNLLWEQVCLRERKKSYNCKQDFKWGAIYILYTKSAYGRLNAEFQYLLITWRSFTVWGLRVKNFPDCLLMYIPSTFYWHRWIQGILSENEANIFRNFWNI